MRSSPFKCGASVLALVLASPAIATTYTRSQLDTWANSAVFANHIGAVQPETLNPLLRGIIDNTCGLVSAADCVLPSGVVTTNLGFTPLRPSNNLSDIGSASTARTNLGLGALAILSTLNLPTYATGTLGAANGGTGLTAFTRSGNTTSFATTNGTLTSGHCAKFDASGNIIDSGAACASNFNIDYSGSHGVACDGTTDDASALNTWFASIPSNTKIAFPAGATCVFKSQLVFPVGNNIIWQFNGAHLLYAGATTAITTITAGTANVAGGCSLKGWQIYDVTVQSSTVLTAGDAVLLNEMCDSGLHNVKIDGNQLGNGKLWGGLHFNGCNTVRIDGESEFRGQSYGIAINGDATYQCTDPFIAGGVVLGSKIGIHICGSVGGFVGTATDVLENGDNVVIDQLCVSRPNLQIFFGSGFFADVTNGTGLSHDLNVLDAGSANSFLSLTGAWFASSTSDNIRLAVAAQQWNLNMTGGAVGNTTGSGIYQNSVNVNTNVVGTQVFSAVVGLYNQAGTLNKCGIMNFPANTANTTGTVGSSC
jgi:hypothetical protein